MSTKKIVVIGGSAAGAKAAAKARRAQAGVDSENTNRDGRHDPFYNAPAASETPTRTEPDPVARG